MSDPKAVVLIALVMAAWGCAQSGSPDNITDNNLPGNITGNPSGASIPSSDSIGDQARTSQSIDPPTGSPATADATTADATTAHSTTEGADSDIEASNPEPFATSPLVPTTEAPPTVAPLQGLELQLVAEDLDQPVLAVSPPADDRLFIVERGGLIRILGVDEPFLDIDDRVNSEDGIEPGLLGLAFHPDYADNGILYVYYYRADRPQTQLSSFEVSEQDANRADPASERELQAFDQPTNRHNGGMLEFDAAGRLFLSLGEGGAASVHAQDPSSPLGAILRYEVTDDLGVAPATGNPFLAGGGAPEVWAYGLRNPWRFDVDPIESLLYIGDVGQERWEEIDVIPSDGEGGANLGWLEMEGAHCFRTGCDPDSYVLPIVEYSHDEGCSVTGGVVYRGSDIPELTGEYLYADWCGGWIRSFRFEGEGSVVEPIQRFDDVGQINGFGSDSRGEVYVLTYEGQVFRIDPLR